MPCHDLDDGENGCLLEVGDECFSLLRHRQVVAPGEEVTHLELVLAEAVEEKVFAETHLRHELSVLRKVVVEVLGQEVLRRALKVADVEPDVEVGLQLLVLRYFLPAESLNSSAIKGLCVQRLRDYLPVSEVLADGRGSFELGPSQGRLVLLTLVRLFGRCRNRLHSLFLLKTQLRGYSQRGAFFRLCLVLLSGHLCLLDAFGKLYRETLLGYARFRGHLHRTHAMRRDFMQVFRRRAQRPSARLLHYWCMV